MIAARLYTDEGAGVRDEGRSPFLRHVPCPRVQFGGIRYDAVHLGHRGKLRAIGLGRASGDDQAGRWPRSAKSSDRLPGLADRLVRDAATVDDDQVLFLRERTPDRFALGNVQPAAERYEFEAW